ILARLPLKMEWESMERCHFSGSEESLGHLVEGEIFSNPLDINADLSILSHSDQRHLMGMGQIELKLVLGLVGRQLRLTVRPRDKPQLPSRAVYINGKDRPQCSVGCNIPSPVGFKFEFRGSVLLHRRQELFEVARGDAFTVGWD